jgi:glycosyltransferase involved in cell wall biosynthesis
LVKKGFEIVIVCPHAPGLLKEDTIDGVRIKRFDYMFSKAKPIVYTGNMHQEVAGSILAKLVFLSFLKSFYNHALKICRAEKADIIWANWWIPPGLVASRIASKFNIPLVISSHGTDISLLGKKGLIAALSRYVYKRTKKATVVSSFLKNKLLNNLSDINAENVHVIPMPVGMENFPRTDPAKNDIPVLLSVARYTRQKRLTDIIAAAEKIAAEGTKFKISMVGEGPLESELISLVQEKDLVDRFEFIPLVAQQKLGELYRQSDAVILSSVGEGFGLVLVEAGLTGRAVIGARSGGITDIIEDNVNGLLFEPGDIEGLANCMRTIFGSRETRTRLGEGGYKIAMDRFATPVLVDQIYSLFSSMVSDH